MHFRILQLFLLLSLFVASTNSAWACGNGSSERCGHFTSGKSCCTKKESKKDSQCCGERKQQDQNALAHKHPENGDCGGCHCPCGTMVSGHSGSLLAELSPILPPLSAVSDATLRQAFYFNEHMPEAVYLPIWQPPKLGA